MSTTKRTPAKKCHSHKMVKSPQPLTPEEGELLHKLVDAAAIHNHDLVRAGIALDEARKRLREAESEYAEERAENQRIHAELAPLLHRLPA